MSIRPLSSMPTPILVIGADAGALLGPMFARIGYDGETVSYCATREEAKVGIRDRYPTVIIVGESLCDDDCDACMALSDYARKNNPRTQIISMIDHECPWADEWWPPRIAYEDFTRRIRRSIYRGAAKELAYRMHLEDD